MGIMEVCFLEKLYIIIWSWHILMILRKNKEDIEKAEYTMEDGYIANYDKKAKDKRSTQKSILLER